MASAAPKVFSSPITRLVEASVNGEDITGICVLISESSKKLSDLAQITSDYSTSKDKR